METAPQPVRTRERHIQDLANAYELLVQFKAGLASGDQRCEVGIRWMTDFIRQKLTVLLPCQSNTVN